MPKPIVHHVPVCPFCQRLGDFLSGHSPSGTFLFDEFGGAEAVFTPVFMRFWFLGTTGTSACPANEDP